MGFAFKMDLAGTMKDVLGVLGKQLVTVDAGLGKVTASVGRFEGAFLAVEAIKTLGSAALSAIGHVIRLGSEIVKINANAQDLNLATRLQLGDEGAAALQRIADSFKNTRFDDDTIKQALLPIANAGIKDAETLDAIATAAVDISTRFNTGQAGFEAATEALGKIATKRTADVKQLAALGINENDFLATLSKSLGRSVESTKKAIAAGKIAAPSLLSAAMQEIANKQGGSIGVAALAGGKTLGASLQRLSDLPSNLLKNLADSPALGKVQASIDHIVEVLSGPRGVALIEKLASGIDQVFSYIVNANVGEVLDNTLLLLDGVGAVINALGTVLNYGVIKPLTWIGENGAAVWGGIYTAGTKIVDFLSTLPTRLKDDAFGVGVSIVTGIAEGIKSGIGAVTDAIGNVGSSAIGSLKSLLGIASPSTVFAQIGAYSTQGLALGIERGTDDVTAASRALGAAMMPSALPAGMLAAQASALAAGAGAPFSVTFGDIIIQTPSTNPAGVADAIEVRLRQMWEGIGTEVGAADAG